MARRRSKPACGGVAAKGLSLLGLLAVGLVVTIVFYSPNSNETDIVFDAGAAAAQKNAPDTAGSGVDRSQGDGDTGGRVAAAADGAAGGADAVADGAAADGAAKGDQGEGAAAANKAETPKEENIFEEKADAISRCQQGCKAKGYCCNDIAVGSNSRLSCAQACMLRWAGVPSSKCNEYCEPEESVCLFDAAGLHFNLCYSCKDITADETLCLYGVPDEGPCIDGCKMVLGTEGAAPPPPPPPPPPPKLAPRVVADDKATERTLERMQWWATGPSPRASAAQYLIHSNDEGGPNNIRIGWEYAGVVAEATGRTYVLPPASKMYLLDRGPMNEKRRHGVGKKTVTKVEDLINLEQLRSILPTLTWEEFTLATGLSWREALKGAEQVDKEHSCDLVAYRKIKAKLLLMPGHGRREGFTCGEWFSRGGPRPALRRQMPASGWALLTHGFVWHQDVFRVAARVVANLGIFSYVALHARYNDFQYKEQRQPEDVIFAKLKSVFAMSPTLYVASDEPARFRNASSGMGIRVVTMDDLLDSLLAGMAEEFGPERRFKLLGPVEELVCTYAKVFVGSKHSSFSGHIHRMRIHAGAPEALFLNHVEPVNVDRISRTVKSWEASGEHKRRPVDRGDQF